MSQLAEHEEQEALHEKHATYFGQLVEAAREKIAGRERRRWLQLLREEIDNLRSVFEVSSVLPEIKLALAYGLADFWEARGEYSEGRSRLDAALDARPDPSRVRSEALQAAGLLAWAQGDQSAAKIGRASCR